MCSVSFSIKNSCKKETHTQVSTSKKLQSKKVKERIHKLQVKEITSLQITQLQVKEGTSHNIHNTNLLILECNFIEGKD